MTGARTCPRCGTVAEYQLESVLVHALLDESGEYEGESEVLWDTQDPVTAPGSSMITYGHSDCGAGAHEWTA